MTTEEQQTADTASQEEKSEQQTTAAEDSRATPPAETASKEADLAEQASTPPPSGSAASCNASIDELAEAGLLKNDSGNTVQPPSESAAVGALTAPTQDTTSLASAESSPTPAESTPRRHK